MPFNIEFRGLETDGKMKVIEYVYQGKSAAKKIPTWGDDFKGLSMVLNSCEPGDILAVTTKKNDKGYIDWVGLERVDADSKRDTVSSDGGLRSPKSGGGNWETPEERAKKQVYIIRQSSLSAAAEVLKSRSVAYGPQEAIEIAEVFTSWVLNGSPGEAPDGP